MPYTWTQTLQDVSISIDLPQAYKARDLDVQIKKSSVSAKIKGRQEFLIKGELHKPVKEDDCNWQMGSFSFH